MEKENELGAILANSEKKGTCKCGNDQENCKCQEISEAELRHKLDLLLRTGKILVESAADTSRIMRTMKRTAAFLGLDERYMHLYVNWNVLMVNYSDEEHSFTKFQRCEKHGINLTSISLISKLSWRAIKEDYSLDQYEQALNEVQATPRSFTPWQVAIGGGFACGGLLFGALAQVIVAGGNFRGHLFQRVARALDAHNDVTQALRGGVGIALDLRKHAVVIAVHARAELAFGQCAEHLADLAQGAGKDVQQVVDAPGQGLEEGNLAVGADARVQLAARGGLDDAGHLALDGQLLGLVGPFDDEPGLALFVEQRGDQLAEMHMADTAMP